MSQQQAVNTILENWNRLEQETATKVILPCNGSRAWAIGVVNEYPFDTPEQLFAVSDKVWRSLPESDWQQAFDSHPRIGEHMAKAATQQSAEWSKAEQSGAQLDDEMQQKLSAVNKEYEAKFGNIFLICATGKSANEVLASLQQRLKNDAATELQEAAEQQRRITLLRLRKWLELPAAKCEEV